jgi:hypothetical protein
LRPPENYGTLSIKRLFFWDEVVVLKWVAVAAVPQPPMVLHWMDCQRRMISPKWQVVLFVDFNGGWSARGGMEIPVCQRYSRITTEKTLFVKPLPAQILRNGLHAQPKQANLKGGKAADA